MTELPFSEFITWMASRCEGGWSIEVDNAGGVVVTALALNHGLAVARNDKFWLGQVEQVRDCIVQIAGKIGVEA